MDIDISILRLRELRKVFKREVVFIAFSRVEEVWKYEFKSKVIEVG